MRIGAGRYKGRALPEAGDARPVPGRLRTSLFSALQHVVPDARVLDLFAGVGGLGLEALSRGAARVTLVERDMRAAARLARWAEDVGAADDVEVVVRDALRGPLPAGPFDLVFVDPPFDLWEGAETEPLLARVAERTAPGGLLVAKVPARKNPPESPGWSPLRRTVMGSVAYVLLRREGGPAGGSSAGGGRPIQGGAAPGGPTPDAGIR